MSTTFDLLALFSFAHFSKFATEQIRIRARLPLMTETDVATLKARTLPHNLIPRNKCRLGVFDAVWIAFPPKASCIDGLSVPHTGAVLAERNFQ